MKRIEEPVIESAAGIQPFHDGTGSVIHQHFSWCDINGRHPNERWYCVIANYRTGTRLVLFSLHNGQQAITE